MRQIELLSPAGDREKLESVIRFGADAVYFGGKAFNLRARSHNFSLKELAETVEYAHSQGKKAYVTLNILAHDREIRSMPNFIKYLNDLRVDAVIVSDLGVIDLVKENSDIDIHISTQSSITNWRAVKVMKQLGAKRVILAREASLHDIRAIRENVPDMELEVFVHGAMCMAYSGRCQLSHYLVERDGNRGACTNTCRWKYHLMEEKRPGEFFPVYEDETGSYLFNSKDLCAIEILDKILDAGVVSLKIEGRMKSALYGATVTGVYRKAIDSYLSGKYEHKAEWLEELQAVSNRGFTQGFFLGGKHADHNNRKGGYTQTHEFVGRVASTANDGSAIVDVRGKVSAGDEVEILTPASGVRRLTMPMMEHLDTATVLKIGHPGTAVKALFDCPVEVGDLLRKRVSIGTK